MATRYADSVRAAVKGSGSVVEPAYRPFAVIGLDDGAVSQGRRPISLWIVCTSLSFCWIGNEVS